MSTLHKRERILLIYVKKDAWADQRKKCKWLGHHIYKCAQCKIGYLYIYGLYDRDFRCPKCGYIVDAEYSE